MPVTDAKFNYRNAKLFLKKKIFSVVFEGIKQPIYGEKNIEKILIGGISNGFLSVKEEIQEMT